MLTLCVDTREPQKIFRELRVQNAQYNFGFKVVRKKLDIGDFAVLTKNNKMLNFVVERKEKDDFVSSIMDGRLFRQILDAYSLGIYLTVIIEGDIYDVYSKFHDHSKIGALASIIRKYKVNVFFVPDQKLFAYAILQMMKQSTSTIDFSSCVGEI